MTRSLAAKSPVRSAACPFCEHANPAAARFCNACGAPTHLIPCARCGAVNDPQAATACYQCGAGLPEDRRGEFARSSSGAETLAAAGSPAWTTQDRTQPIEQPPAGPDGLDRDAKLLQDLQQLLASSDSGAVADRLVGESIGTPAANADIRTAVAPVTRIRAYAASAIAGSPSMQAAPRVIPRRGLAIIVGVGVLAVLAAAGEYYTYQERMARSASQAPASGAMKEGDSPAATPPVATDTQPTAPAADGSAMAIRPGTTAPVEARPAATPPVAGSSGEAMSSPRRAPVEAKASAETAPTGPRPRAGAPGVIEQPPRVGPCTEAVAALGLCAPESAQRRQ